MNYWPDYILRALTRWAIFTALLAGGLFLAAGTTRLVFLRAYIAVFSAIILPTYLLVDPGLYEERLHPGGAAQDKGERFIVGLLFLATIVTAAVDVGRLALSNDVPAALSLIALIVFAAGLSFVAWAAVANPFFSSAVRLQSERGHHLITHGPYRWLRHPGYLGMNVAILASPLAIGSWLALIPAVAFCLAIVRRAGREDQFLKDNLLGYPEYVQRVRGRLFPHVSALGAAILALFCVALIAAFFWDANANSTAGLKLPPSSFNEQQAFQYLKLTLRSGPRPPGSKGNKDAELTILEGLLASGVSIDDERFLPFEASTPLGKIKMTNIIAKISGALPDVVILGGHYDTKRMMMRFVVANDGGSSAAFLIEIARALVRRKNRFTYWIVFFDGEEALKHSSATDGLYGSRHFVESLTQDQLQRIRAMINVDMIGDRNLHIHRESHSNPQLTNLIFHVARTLGYGRYFLDPPVSVEDDHIPFIRAGIPAVDLISLDYGPLNLYWHTPLDTVGKCSPQSLRIVARVLLKSLDDLEHPNLPATGQPLAEGFKSGTGAVSRSQPVNGWLGCSASAVFWPSPLVRLGAYICPAVLLGELRL